MRYRKILALVLALLMLAASGCTGRTEEAPQSTVPGYYSQQQVLSGGSKVKDANLADVDVVRKQEDVCFTLHFVQGSKLDTASALSKLPEYTVEPMTAPSRLKVTIHNTLCEFLGQEIEPAGEFLGLITEKTETGIVLYMQFMGQVAYKIEENAEEGSLTLRVRADDAASVEQYHVRIPYREESTVAKEFALLPVLCDDGVSMYSLSSGFESIEEADAHCKAVNEALEAAGSDDTAEVIRMNSGAAPVYTEPVSRSMLTMMGALKTDDSVIDGELIAMDARFLCWTDDGGMVMARPIVQEDVICGEELWVYNLNTGRREQLSEAVFVSVQKAAFSKDNRYIAIMDADEGARLMYLFDRRTGGLTFLTSEGMGDYTADFVWGSDGRLYAMCGDDSMQLMAYDPAMASSGEDAFTTMEEREGSFGSVGWADDRVCFADADGKIYTLDAQTQERTLLEESGGFVLSPDGQKMLLTDVEETDAGVMTTLRLRDMATGLTLQIAQEMSLSGYVWAEDSSALFYLTSNKSAQDAQDYPVRLMRYTVKTGATEDLGALASNMIFRGRTSDDVIVLFYQQRGEVFFPVTYAIDLTGGKLNEDDELIVTIE